jgi:hypothetical protein
MHWLAGSSQNSPMKTTFKGNKQSLPSKPCTVCGRDMTWRKAWAKNWDQVLYCSEACRKNKSNSTPNNTLAAKHG